MKMCNMVWLALLVAFVGCANGRSDTDANRVMDVANTAADSDEDAGIAPDSPAACAKAGGTWRRAGLRQLEVCDLPTRDAGKPCRSSAECQIACVAPKGADPAKEVAGTCFHSTITVGVCFSEVNNGRIVSAQCAD